MLELSDEGLKAAISKTLRKLYTNPVETNENLENINKEIDSFEKK